MFMTAKLISMSFPHIIFLCMMRAPEIYFLTKFPVLSTAFVTVVITLHVGSRDLFILHHCDFALFDQHPPKSPHLPTPGNHLLLSLCKIFNIFRFHI